MAQDKPILRSNAAFTPCCSAAREDGPTVLVGTTQIP
jgi:hypothetical protein